jgi:hypothetical protein
MYARCDLFVWVAIAAAVLLALSLRIWGLSRESIWEDEAASLRFATNGLGLLSYEGLTQETNPPLYYLECLSKPDRGLGMLHPIL